MPDFRVIGQSPIEGPNLGAEYDRGLGGASPSDFGNLVTGLQQGLDFGSRLDARLKQTARDNDPKKIAAEQLGLDLKNETTQQALERSRFDLDLDRELERDERTVGIDLDRASLTSKRLDNALTRAYGADKIASDIYQNYNGGRYGRRNAMTDKERYALMNDFSERVQQLQSERDDIVPPAAADRNRAPGQAPFTQNLSPTQQARLATIDKQIAEQQKYIADLQNPTPEDTTEQYVYDDTRQRAQFENEVAQMGLGNSRARAKRANEDLRQADIAARSADSPYVPANQANEAWLNKMASVVQNYSGTASPEAKQVISQGIAAQLNFVGPDQIEAWINNGELREDERQNAQRTMDNIRAYSKDPNMLSQTQKDIQNAGLPEKYVADTQTTEATLASYLKGGETAVDDSEFKTSLRGDPYITAMQEALRKSPDGTARPEVGNVNLGENNGLDVAGQPQSQQYVKFYDSTGKELPVNTPYVKNNRSDAILNMLGGFAKNQAFSAGQEQAARAQGEQLIGQNRSWQSQMREPSTLPQVPLPGQQQQAPIQQAPVQQAPVQPVQQQPQQPFGAPAQQPQQQRVAKPYEGKSAEYIYDPRKGEDWGPDEGPQAFRYKANDGSTRIRNYNFGLDFPENYRNVRSGRLLDPLTNRPDKDLTAAERVREAQLKPIKDQVREREARLRSESNILDAVSKYNAKVSAAGQQGIFGAAGIIPKTKAQLAQMLEVTSTENQQKIRDLVSEGEMIRANVLREFLSGGNVTSAANTKPEQETILKAVMGENSEFSTLQLFEQTERARVEKERNVLDAARALFTVDDNEGANIENALKQYSESDASKPFIVNPQRFERYGTQWRAIPGTENLPEFVPNTFENGSDTPYMPFRDYMLAEEGDMPPSKEPPPPPPEPPVKNIGFQGDATVDPQGVSGPDVIGTSVDYQEADLAGNQVGPFNQPGDLTLANQTPDSGATERFQGAPQVNPQQAPREMLEAPQAEVDLRTEFEKRGNKFADPTEAQIYKGVLDQFEGEVGKNLGLWLTDIATVNQGEEIETFIRKKARDYGFGEDLTDRQIELIAAAREEAIRKMGQSSIPLSMGKFAVEGAAAIAQSLATSQALGGAKVGQAIAKVAPKLKAIPWIGNFAAKAAPAAGIIARDAVGDATTNQVRQHVPGQDYFSFDKFQQDVALNAGGQVLFGKVLQVLPKVKEMTIGVDDATAGARVMSKMGASKEEVRDMAKSGDPRSGQNQVMRRLGEEIATDPKTRPLVQAANKARIQTRDALRQSNEAMAFKARNSEVLHDEFANRIEATAGDRLAAADLEASKTLTAANESASAFETQKLQEALAVQNAAARQANQEVFRRTSNVVDNIVQGTVREADDSLNSWKEFAKKGQAFSPQKIVRPDGSETIIPRLDVERTALETARDNIHGAANWAYTQLDEPLQIDDDLLQRVYKDFTDPQNPMGRGVVENTYQSIGGQKVKQVLGNPDGSTSEIDFGLSSDARSLIEMRRTLMSKQFENTPQARKLVDSIESALNEQMERAEWLPDRKDNFNRFMNAQVSARRAADVVDRRIKTIDAIQKELYKSRSSGNSFDAVLVGKRKELQEIYSPEMIKKFENELRAVDKFNALVKRAEKAAEEGKAVIPEAKVIAQGGELQAEFIRERSKTLADDIVKAAKEALKEDRLSVNDSYFVERLINSKTGLADKVAQGLGYADRQAFGEAATDYLRTRYRDRQARGNLQNITQLHEMFGMEKSAFENALSFLPNQSREMLEKTVERQMKVEPAGGFFDYPMRSQEIGERGTMPKLRNIGYSTMVKVGAFLDIAHSNLIKDMPIRERAAFARHLADDTPEQFANYLNEVAEKLKPASKGGGTYSNWMAYNTARQVARGLYQGYGQPAETKRIAQMRSNVMQDRAAYEGGAQAAASVPKPPTVDEIRRRRREQAQQAPSVLPKTSVDEIRRRRRERNAQVQ